MRLLKRLAGFLGYAKDEEFGDRQQNAESNFKKTTNNNLNPKGFSVPVYRSPVLVPCTSNGAGVQGLRWFARSLKIDEDGDVADEFLEEVLPNIRGSMQVDQIPVTSIEVKYIVRPAKVRNQVLSSEGKLQHCVEHQGRLQWL